MFNLTFRKQSRPRLTFMLMGAGKVLSVVIAGLFAWMGVAPRRAIGSHGDSPW